MADSLFKANPNLPQIGHRFQARADKAIERIWTRIQKYGQQWARDAARVTPVETGLLRQNYFVVPVRNGHTMTILLANHLKYGRFLEFGTKFIAGGAVLSWTQGQPVIRSWPAKMANLQPPSSRAKPTTHARFQARLARAMGPEGEQMPFIRPTGQELVPRIIADVQRIVREEFSRAA